MVDSEAEDGVKKKKKKKSKKESGSDVIGNRLNSESSKVCEKPLVHTDDADEKTRKRKRDDCEENTDKKVKRKHKKKKQSVDSEVEDINLNSTEDAKKISKEKKTSEDSVVEENNKDSAKEAKEKLSEDSEAEENSNDGKDAKKKRKKKQESVQSDKDVTTPSTKGMWANVYDYKLLEELLKLDAACIDDVDWDDLLENRDGEACRKRWNQMIIHIGVPKSKTFAEQVEILSERYRPDIAENLEDFDNRPYDPEY
ncbi:Myb-like domain [Arabidopsis suecica]|uniref:Myb-like domain n=1 Tax=Arabidopsis suecica TaxID=45249 RepID=A0A8T2BMT2_ARASU|nr:Myb-like domain [Arabidopsis suecica]